MVSKISLGTALVVVAAAVVSQDARAFAVFTNEADFLLQYKEPTTVVGLDSPAPSSYTGVSYSLGGGATAYEIREDGWSTLFNIGSLRTDGCCWGASTWYGSDVSPSIYDRPANWINRLYVSLLTPSPVVISLKTSAGFFGLVPTDPSDTFFALPVDATLSEVALGYSEATVVPEPSSVALALMALGLLSGVRRARQGQPLWVVPGWVDPCVSGAAKALSERATLSPGSMNNLTMPRLLK